MIPEGMISVAEAARRLGRSIEQVRRYLREGKLKGQRIGQQWFIEEASLGVRYELREPQVHRIGEAVAVMETARTAREKMEALIRRIDGDVEAMRRRLGRDLDTDIVEMLREDRESH
ncbi:MAG TPA: helix-turn-helix domain-containing protein [Dehalococcoidia bacterium]|nr:helix-turn-helix domain-containing protein [Dehalococcoidia bacterium]